MTAPGQDLTGRQVPLGSGPFIPDNCNATDGLGILTIWRATSLPGMAMALALPSRQ